MSTSNTNAVFRKSDPTSVLKTMRISGNADSAVENLRELWLKEYPASKYPSLALLFEVALQRLVSEIGNEPEALKQEVEQVKRFGFGFRMTHKKN
jgi:hypothetical protein